MARAPMKIAIGRCRSARLLGLVSKQVDKQVSEQVSTQVSEQVGS